MTRKSMLVMALIFLVNTLGLTFKVERAEASETIYIRADGSVEGPTHISTVDNVIYTFTDDIYDEIVVERDNIVVDGADYTLQGTGAILSRGIDLTGRRNVTIKNMETKAFTYSIWLEHSSNNSIFGNHITTDDGYGIGLSLSSNNTISRNNITNNNCGIVLGDSFNNTISRNNITANNLHGIWFYNSSGNSISENDVTNNKNGIFLDHASNNNCISGNNITKNNCGIWSRGSSNNIIHHNDFVDNTEQVESHDSTNVWNDDYPHGGNYWSDYEKRYPNATELDNSRIWDTPYIIDENNQDNYPMIPEFSSFIIMPLFMIATLAVIIIRKLVQCKKKSKVHTVNCLYHSLMPI